MRFLNGARSRILTGAVYGALVAITLVPASVALLSSHSWSFQVKALALTVAVTAAAALIQSVTSRGFSLAVSVFWLWSYVFLGLAPLYQLGTGIFPWLGEFSDATVTTALTIVLLGSATAYLATALTYRYKLRREYRQLALVPPVAKTRSLQNVLTVVLALYVAAAILFILVTGSALFEGKAAFQLQLVANGAIPGSGTLFFFSTAGAIALPAIAIVCKRNGVNLSWPLLVAVTVLGFIVTNPLTGSRFLTGSFLLALVASLLVRTELIRYMPAGIGVVFVTLFPSLDLARGDGTGSEALAVAPPSATLVTFDFDSFEMLLREVNASGIFSSQSIERIDLLIAPFLRWIPFLSDSVQGNASGPVVARLTGMTYTNVSMPLWGESHLIGGMLGIALAFALLGLIFGLMRPSTVPTALRPTGPINLAVDAPVAALLFIFLRGSLYEVTGYLVFALGITALLWGVFKWENQRASIPAIQPDHRPRTIAFYLPQFHAIPENDEWWGAGFTEWANVRRAKPAFDGHDHPRQSTELGEYDLSEVSVMHAQAELARQNDVDAFCFYFYWFAGKRLLEKPIDQYLSDGPDFPFCISWANENWSRRWDGKEKESLIKQEYSDDTAREVFDSFLPYLQDPRYVRVNGAAVIMIHRADHLPAASDYAKVWRERAIEAGVGALHIVAAETNPGIRPEPLGFDAVAEFPPVGSNTLSAAQILPPRELSPSFRGRLMSYRRLATRFMSRPAPDFVRYRSVVPGWDNSARRQEAATVYLAASPFEYRNWLNHARSYESRLRSNEGLVFVNAWNEWAEGAHLEPDATSGRAYLNATRWSPETEIQAAPNLRVGWPSYPWARSLALAAAGSALQTARRLRGAISFSRR